MKKKYTFIKHAFIAVFALYSLTGFSQILNFTIDTAIDNGTTITETIVSGDTYVLTINHSGNEELDDLGGGDKIFYLSATDPLTPYTLSITKNGTPYNFTLNSIDYDTLGAGDISLENNTGAVIASQQTYAVGSGSINIDNTSNAMNIKNFTISPYDTDDLNDFGFHNINVNVLGETLSIKNKDLNTKLLVYPNPSNGIFTLKSIGVKFQEAQIMDLNGRIVTSIEINNSLNSQEFDFTRTLKSGIYLLRIQSESATIIKKIIIN